MIAFERISDAAGARRWLELARTCIRVDHPGMVAGSLEEIMHQLSGVQRSSRYAHFLAVEDGADVAHGTVRLPLRDNLAGATVSLSVLPSRRRRGIGTALAREILAFVSGAGRTHVAWTVGSPVGKESPGRAFSRLLGARKVLSRLRRELDLRDVDDSKLDDLVNARIEGRDSDYDIVTWVDRAPDALVDGVANLVGRMSTDTPRGDLSTDPEVRDASRWRGGGRCLPFWTATPCGRRCRSQRPLGGFHGHRRLGSRASRRRAVEHDVDPDHRGHRLGLAIKVANLRNLRREIPGALGLETWNTLENFRIVAINELLGFHIVESVDEYQLSL